MPVYEYKCEACGNIIADLIPWHMAGSEEVKAARTCPKCGGEAKKIISVPAKPYVRV